jgi:hypothetical protein
MILDIKGVEKMNRQQEWIDKNPICWMILQKILNAISFYLKWIICYIIFRTIVLS